MATYNFTVTSVAVPFVAEFAKNLPLIVNSNKQLDKEFKSGTGDTMTVTLPDYPTVISGATAVPDNYSSGDRIITLEQNNVSIDSNAVVRALDIKNFGDQVATPYAARLASHIQERSANYIKENADSHVVISASSEFKDLGSAISGIKKARSYGKLVGVLDCELNQTIAAAGLNFFNPSASISDMFKNSKIGMYGGAEFYESADVTSLVTGDLQLGTATVKTTLVDGATVLTIADGALSGGETIAKGQGFKVAGVKVVDIYGKAISQDYTFVALADAVAIAGEVAITIKPVTVAKPLQNVSILPVAGAVVSQVQDADSTYQAGVIYDTTSFIFANAKFAPISGCEQKEMKVAKSLSVTTTKGPDPINFKEIVRWDVLNKELLARTSWASVVWFKA